ncbi:hypothetical protein D3C71_2024320 [compost metagenome]
MAPVDQQIALRHSHRLRTSVAIREGKTGTETNCPAILIIQSVNEVSCVQQQVIHLGSLFVIGKSLFDVRINCASDPDHGLGKKVDRANDGALVGW